MEVRICKVWFDKQEIFVQLNDGSVINAPLSLYKGLQKATETQLKSFELWNAGKWIHWEELDEDLSAEGFLKLHKEQV